MPGGLVGLPVFFPGPCLLALTLSALSTVDDGAADDALVSGDCVRRSPLLPASDKHGLAVCSSFGPGSTHRLELSIEAAAPRTTPRTIRRCIVGWRGSRCGDILHYTTLSHRFRTGVLFPFVLLTY